VDGFLVQNLFQNFSGLCVSACHVCSCFFILFEVASTNPSTQVTPEMENDRIIAFCLTVLGDESWRQRRSTQYAVQLGVKIQTIKKTREKPKSKGSPEEQLADKKEYIYILYI